MFWPCFVSVASKYCLALSVVVVVHVTMFGLSVLFLQDWPEEFPRPCWFDGSFLQKLLHCIILHVFMYHSLCLSGHVLHVFVSFWFGHSGVLSFLYFGLANVVHMF